MRALLIVTDRPQGQQLIGLRPDLARLSLKGDDTLSDHAAADLEFNTRQRRRVVPGDAYGDRECLARDGVALAAGDTIGAILLGWANNCSLGR